MDDHEPRGGGRPRVLWVDGLAIRTSLSPPGVPVVDRDPDWALHVNPQPLALEDEATQWTGDVRDGGAVWARFGRVGATNRIHLAGVGDLCVSKGEREASLHLARSDRSPTAAFRRLVPYLAAADGRLVLHASCALLDGGAVLFCGASGTGKSTLALALDAMGFPVLADDHVVVEPRGEDASVHASFPFVEADGAACALLRPQVETPAHKAPLALVTPRPAGPYPVVRLAFLERGPGPIAEPLRTATAFKALVRDVVFIADPASTRELGSHLDSAVALVRTAPAVRLTLPEGLGRLRDALPSLPAVLGLA